MLPSVCCCCCCYFCWRWCFSCRWRCCPASPACPRGSSRLSPCRRSRSDWEMFPTSCEGEVFDINFAFLLDQVPLVFRRLLLCALDWSSRLWNPFSHKYFCNQLYNLHTNPFKWKLYNLHFFLFGRSELVKRENLKINDFLQADSLILSQQPKAEVMMLVYCN